LLPFLWSRAGSEAAAYNRLRSMTPHPGTRVGHYEIVSALGAGGMGEVYRARDGRLNRDVAIKILPPHLAIDQERIRRVDREAQLVRVCPLRDARGQAGVRR
jgi:serine/threonine protein kinase